MKDLSIDLLRSNHVAALLISLRGAEIEVFMPHSLVERILALARGDMDMVAFFKSMEPDSFQDTKNKLLEVKIYGLPDDLLSFLLSENGRFDFEKTDFYHECKYIDFFSLADTMPMKVGRQKNVETFKKVGCLLMLALHGMKNCKNIQQLRSLIGVLSALMRIADYF